MVDAGHWFAGYVAGPLDEYFPNRIALGSLREVAWIVYGWAGGAFRVGNIIAACKWNGCDHWTRGEQCDTIFRFIAYAAAPVSVCGSRASVVCHHWVCCQCDRSG